MIEARRPRAAAILFASVAGQGHQDCRAASALAAQPEIRPEVVARGQALAADPNYPSTDILRSVAAKLIASPDLTADES